MAVEVPMPRLSDSMEEGTVVKWLVAVGDEVSRGQPIAEIETDKATMTYEADSDGVLLAVLAEEGDTLAIGTPIAVIGAPGERAPSGPRPAAVDPPPADAGPAARPKASPVARRMARELGIDIEAIAGSGPGGRIVKRDVEEAAKEAADGASPPAPASSAKGDVEIVELSRLQTTVARRMSDSRATVPDFALEATVDMTAAAELRERLKAVADPVPSFNDMIIRACAIALREHPRANGSYRDGRFELHSRVNVGIAVAADDALVVPTIFDADRKGLGAIAAESRGLAERVRDGSITPPELAGGTFTVSNLGMFGVTRFTAVINPPQAAILAVGAIEDAPAVRDGRLAVAKLMGVTLACDHRILYGADGARFLARVRALLEEPLALAL